MNKATKCFLAKTTSDFYQAHAQSFSETRKTAWYGWNTCAQLIQDDIMHTQKHMAPAKDSIVTPNLLQVCDIACGNLRLVQFLSELMQNDSSMSYKLGGPIAKHISYTGIDQCDPLVQSANCHTSSTIDITTINTNIIEKLISQYPIADDKYMSTYDLVCCFGFFHHVPGSDTRLYLLNKLIELAKPQGYIVLSAWSFMRNQRIAAQAKTITQEKLNDPSFFSSNEQRTDSLLLEPNDYFLGWQKDTSSVRYCHHTNQEELTQLLNSLSYKADVIARFDADGKQGNLNQYVILKRLA